MSPFIETLKVYNGEISNLSYHQARFERTRSEMLGLKNHPALEEKIILPEFAKKGLYKCRLLYDIQEFKIEFHAHTPAQIRSLKLIRDDQVNYTYKSTDRTALTKLFRQRGKNDDILIAKNGWITDSYIANVVFWDGSRWFTPDTPLLSGCMRASLIESGIIEETGIRVKDLPRFRSLKLINALNDWNDAPLLPLEALNL